MLDRLIAKQLELDKTDAEFAERLGIPRVTWTHYRTGRIKSMTPRLARAAKRAFPEMAPEADIFLLYGDSEQTDAVSDRTESVA